MVLAWGIVFDGNVKKSSIENIDIGYITGIQIINGVSETDV